MTVSAADRALPKRERRLLASLAELAVAYMVGDALLGGCTGALHLVPRFALYCIDVLTQISAVQAALDKVALGLLDQHANHCVMGAEDDAETQAKTDELMAAVGRLMRRG
ncbi:MAG: hypothetical protein JWQ18_81 [Conexibacter sp.]|nr:hypothetical protein [Conexibacter sp.]